MIAMMGLEERIGFRWNERRTPWVAQITGTDSKYGLARRFLKGKRDYRDASSSGKSGVRLYFTLPEGYFEVREILSMTRERRYFVRSVEGRVAEVEREEIDAWLLGNQQAVKEWLRGLSASAGSASTS